MIETFETQFFILTVEQYREYSKYAKSLGVTIDYLLDEFMDISGPDVEWNGKEWVEVCDG